MKKLLQKISLQDNIMVSDNRQFVDTIPSEPNYSFDNIGQEETNIPDPEKIPKLFQWFLIFYTIGIIYLIFQEPIDSFISNIPFPH